jgi:hypothetical protein
MASCAAVKRRGRTSTRRNERLVTVNAPTDCGDPGTNGRFTQLNKPDLQLLSHRQTSDCWLTDNERTLCVSFAGTRTPQPTKQPGTQPLPDNRHKLHTRTHYLEPGQPTVASPLHSTNKPPAIVQPTLFSTASGPQYPKSKRHNACPLPVFEASLHQLPVQIDQNSKWKKANPMSLLMPPVAC